MSAAAEVAKIRDIMPPTAQAQSVNRRFLKLKLSESGDKNASNIETADCTAIMHSEQ